MNTRIPPTLEIPMDAIELLEMQHEEVESLFDQIDDARSPRQKQILFAEIGDALAVHAAIEEQLFYPAVNRQQTNDFLLESTEEHLAAKRLIADLIELPPTDEHFTAKLNVLKEQVLHHVREERQQLFSQVRHLLDDEELDVLGAEMEAMAAELQAGTRAPRLSVPAETEEAAPLR